MVRFNVINSFSFVVWFAVICSSRGLSSTEECHDVLGRECFRYKDEDCVGVYETWARMNCKLRCGYCPQKLPCEDTINYCDQFGPDVCRQEIYGQYMREHCRKFCNFCRAPTEYLLSSTTTTTTTAPTTQTTTYNPVSKWCCDKRNCWYYPDEKCVGLYEDWARRNCPFGCGFCPNYLPPCVDLDPSCNAFPLEACTNLTYRAYMRGNCRKRCNECHYPGETLDANIPPSPFNSMLSSTKCANTRSTSQSSTTTTTTRTSAATTRTTTATTRSIAHIHTTTTNTKLPTEESRFPSTSAALQLNTTKPMTSPPTKVQTQWTSKHHHLQLVTIPNRPDGYQNTVFLTASTHHLYSGQTFMALCSVSGLHTVTDIYQMFTVEWYFNEQRISIFATAIDERYKMSSSFSNTVEEFKLLITGVQKSDTGNYTCKISDRRNGSVREKTWDLRVDYLVTVSGNSHQVQRNKTFWTYCRISGYQSPSEVYQTSTVEWLFNGQLIAYNGMLVNNQKYQLNVNSSSTELEYLLKITGVTVSDSGNYTCIVADKTNRNRKLERIWSLNVSCLDCSQEIFGK